VDLEDALFFIFFLPKPNITQAAFHVVRGRGYGGMCRGPESKKSVCVEPATDEKRNETNQSANGKDI
jgi:hypothetical protein